MKKFLIQSINILFLVALNLGVGFLSIFYLGSYDQFIALKRNLLFFFLERFFSVFLIGSIGVLFLILVNWGLNSFFIPQSPLKIKMIILWGFLSVLVVSLIGCAMFFFL